MKIIKREPLSLSEIAELLGKKQEGESKKVEMMREYLGRFAKLKPEEAKKLKEDLKALGITKLNDEHIVKIVDILPADADDIRKIFFGSSVSLNQDEIQKVLEVVAKYRK